MSLSEITITKAIIERFFRKFIGCIDVDTAIVGAGPAGMVASYFLAKVGHKVVIFERKLSVGGGMWGGGMMFNEIVVHAPSPRRRAGCIAPARRQANS